MPGNIATWNKHQWISMERQTLTINILPMCVCVCVYLYIHLFVYTYTVKCWLVRTQLTFNWRFSLKRIYFATLPLTGVWELVSWIWVGFSPPYLVRVTHHVSTTYDDIMVYAKYLFSFWESETWVWCKPKYDQLVTEIPLNLQWYLLLVNISQVSSLGGIKGVLCDYLEEYHWEPLDFTLLAFSLCWPCNVHFHYIKSHSHKYYYMVRPVSTPSKPSKLRNGPGEPLDT